MNVDNYNNRIHKQDHPFELVEDTMSGWYINVKVINVKGDSKRVIIAKFPEDYAVPNHKELSKELAMTCYNLLTNKVNYYLENGDSNA